jgi:4-diphosphocytidyl-2-C-methyl-D-erythritol kinase
MAPGDWTTRLPARAHAPAKVNLGLFVGPARDDGRHELATVMQSISLADELTLERAPDGAPEDEVICPALPGAARENLAARALGAFRARTGWRASPLRLTIAKRIPVAAGLGGGSADAAATLRLARHVSGLGDEPLLLELARELGADVPAQVTPGRWLATGAGERLQPLVSEGSSLAVLVLAGDAELSTAAVYAEADRLGIGRTALEIDRLRDTLGAAWGAPASAGGELAALRGELAANDLQAAALALCPQLASTLQLVASAGADRAVVSGSGPTVLGLFVDRPSAGDVRAGVERARDAAAHLGDRSPAPLCAMPVAAEAGRARTLAAP